MSDKLETKLSNLPKTPGVYFFKDKSGEIIYIGKAAVLRNRVRQYFQKSRAFDPKTDALVAEIIDIDWTEVETELDAVFLEAEMVRRYMPRYNILLRDDKSFVYVRIDINSKHPTVTFTRRPLDDKAQYYGPYQSKLAISSALKHLRRIFPYSTHAPTNVPKRACLQAQIGLCPGLEADMTSLEDYRKNLRQLILYITGKRKKLINQIEKDMNSYAKASEYEKAAKARDRLFAIKNLDQKIIFGDRERMDISKDQGLTELAQTLELYEPKPQVSHSDGMQGDGEQRSDAYKKYDERAEKSSTQQSAERVGRISGSAKIQDHPLRELRRIEGYDISHMQGTDTVASMVVFIAGVPAKDQYRKFKSYVAGNDDFAHMREVLARRLSERNIKSWGVPDLILIDGGKGQVSSALSVLIEKNLQIPLIGIAKRYEEIIVPKLAQNTAPPSSSQIATPSQIASANNQKSDYTGVNTSQNSKNEIAKVSQFDNSANFKNKNEAKIKFETIRLEPSSNALKLLQRIRDESHRFAISYHSSLKGKRQTASVLDGIPGIGPTTRKKLIKHFGSTRGVTQASEKDIATIIGTKKAKYLKDNLYN